MRKAHGSETDSRVALKTRNSEMNRAAAVLIILLVLSVQEGFSGTCADGWAVSNVSIGAASDEFGMTQRLLAYDFFSSVGSRASAGRIHGPMHNGLHGKAVADVQADMSIVDVGRNIDITLDSGGLSMNAPAETGLIFKYELGGAGENRGVTRRDNALSFLSETDADATRVPTAVLLLGSGLVGFVGFRRKERY